MNDCINRLILAIVVLNSLLHLYVFSASQQIIGAHLEVVCQLDQLLQIGIPEGYEYVDGERTEKSQWVEFTDDKQGYIQIRVMDLTEASAYTYDSQSNVGEYVKVGDHEGQLTDEKGCLTLFWIDEQQGKATIILATDLSQEGLLQLAESIRHQK